MISDPILVNEFSGFKTKKNGESEDSKDYFNFNSKKQITSEDLFVKNSHRQIEGIITKAIKQTYNIPELHNLNASDTFFFIVEDAPFTNVFMINKKGITFYYPPYILTEGFYGPFMQFVSYDS